MRLSKGLSVSRKRLQTLNSLKRTVTLTDEALTYIDNYQRIYKKVIREAKKRKNDVYVTESVDKSKAVWWLINRQLGKTTVNEQKFQLKVGNRVISNPSEITDKLNLHFVNTVKELIKQKDTDSIYDLEIIVPIQYLFTL